MSGQLETITLLQTEMIITQIKVMEMGGKNIGEVCEITLTEQDNRLNICDAREKSSKDDSQI